MTPTADMTMARKSDGLILHDRVLEPNRLSSYHQACAGRDDGRVATQTTANVRGDNGTGMTEPSLPGTSSVTTVHTTVAYVAYHADS